MPDGQFMQLVKSMGLDKPQTWLPAPKVEPTIGPARPGDRYIPPTLADLQTMDNPAMGLAEIVLGGRKPQSVIAKDPYGTEAFRLGAGEPPMLMGSIEAKFPRFTKAVKAYHYEGPGFNVFHGSPHDFPPVRHIRMPDGVELYQRMDQLAETPAGAVILKEYPIGRFDMSKVGTGEGAQAYGHGLYFAENPGTAKVYQTALGKDALHLPNGDRIKPDPGSIEERALSFLATYTNSGLGIENPHRFARQQVQNLIDRGHGENLAGHRAQLEAVKAKLWEWEQAGVNAGPGGRMYEVNIHADPEDFLDWDKPLSQQSETMQERLRPSVEYLKTRPLNDKIRERLESGRATGHDIYMWLSGEKTFDVARQTWPNVPKSPAVIGTETMKQAGIPGIKYLDQGSRGNVNVNDMRGTVSMLETAVRKNPTDGHLAERLASAKQELKQAEAGGTRNFVVFDDALVSILKKYGVALPVIEGLRRKSQHQGVTNEDLRAVGVM